VSLKKIDHNLYALAQLKEYALAQLKEQSKR